MDNQAEKEWLESVSVDTTFNEEESISLLKRLKKPQGMVDVVLDTDTYNEIDDQYALSYLLKSDEKLITRAIYAAPFKTYRVNNPGEGMEKSYEEILNMLSLMDRKGLYSRVFKGSENYLSDEKTPNISPAAKDLAERAMGYTSKNPLYVVGIAALTNIASALLLRPEIKDRIVIVWLGGNALDWPVNNEFNLAQDIAAARVVFKSGAPLIQLPCMGVVSSFSASGPELIHHLSGKNKLCDYLLEVTQREAIACGGGITWSRPIWDVTAVAWLLDGDLMYDRIIKAPIPEYDDYYAFSENNHFYKYVYHIQRDNLFRDLFEKLSK